MAAAEPDRLVEHLQADGALEVFLSEAAGLAQQRLWRRAAVGVRAGGGTWRSVRHRRGRGVRRASGAPLKVPSVQHAGGGLHNG